MIKYLKWAGVLNIYKSFFVKMNEHQNRCYNLILHLKSNNSEFIAMSILLVIYNVSFIFFTKLDIKKTLR